MPASVEVLSESELVLPDVQATDVKLPHAPDSNWMEAPAVLKAEPMLPNVIFTCTLCATNLYHTSVPVVPVQVLDGTADAEGVAANKVPAVLEQVVPEAMVVTFAQLSFAGGGMGWVTQIEKVLLF